MPVNRRKFLKAAVGSAGIGVSSGIFFPKPVNAYSINYVLSADGTSDAVFTTFQEAQVALNESAVLAPSTEPAVVAEVQATQNQFVQREFTQNETPFAQRLGNVNNPLWGQQKQEDVGPNPGFGTVQLVRNRLNAISFTGATTAGIDRAMLILGQDEKLPASQLDAALVPTRERFEDWGTWRGDVNPETGEYLGPVSLANYETRYGSVLRRYEVLEPGLGGRGRIRLDVDGGQRIRARILIDVMFS